jgi:hypothetical protein
MSWILKWSFDKATPSGPASVKIERISVPEIGWKNGVPATVTS